MWDEKYDEKAFGAELNENMADDPYGTTMYVIGQALKASLAPERGDGMSEGEANRLRAMARLYVELDVQVRCPVCGMMGGGNYIDLDPGDPEVGPQPNVVACFICNLDEAKEQGWEE